MAEFTRREALAAVACGAGAAAIGSRANASLYTPDLASLRRHAVPDWFKDAKLGIFVHWGPYSVPAFAPTGRDVTAAGEAEEGFALNPYAEWYRNTMRFEGSPTALHHTRRYGADTPYEAFGPMFNASLKNWSPAAWADQFARAGARYVVLVAKHHDGFLMWPSATPNPHVRDWGVSRDVVGELAQAVRARGLKFGLYYSGGLDWTFKDVRIDSFPEIFAAMPTDAAYVDYVGAHYRELIARYRPDYLWNDIAYPSETAFEALAAFYYDTVADGLINDRWITPEGLASPHAFDALPGATGLLPPEPTHWDVRTPEYGLFDAVRPFYWEATRGIGKSFGYNREEGEQDFLTSPELARTLAQASMFNGNLLLNVGPRGDARIDPPQALRLDALGVWLQTAGEALFDTRPVELATREAGGLAVGATRSKHAVYLHLLGTPSAPSIDLPLPAALRPNGVRMLGGGGDATVRWKGDRLAVTVAHWPPRPIQIIRLGEA